MTYSEIREAYLLSSSLNKEIYIGTLFFCSGALGSTEDLSTVGSTHNITPRNFVDDLKVLELSGVGSRSVPNGLSLAGAHTSYQEYYDEKYFTPDPPPPQRAAPPVSKESKHTAGKLVKTASSISSSSGVEKEEKKKKRFFGF